MKVIFAGTEVEVVEPVDGFRVISALAHPVVFEDGEAITPNPEVAGVVKATMVEEVKEELPGVKLVEATPIPDPKAEAALREFAEAYPDVRVISSMLSIAAFRQVFPGLVIGPVVTPETSRKPPAEKRAYRDKWSC